MLRTWSTLTICVFLTINPGLGFDPKKQEEQRRILVKARAECAVKIQNSLFPTDGVYCNMTFDNLLCWNYTIAGTVAKQRCPSYIYMFKKENYATRICRVNGTWSSRPGNYNTSSSGWTNFSQCVDHGEKVPEFVREHMFRWRIIYNVGYSISIVSLSVAMVILICFKKLRCPRNRIHVHLFFSFAVRAGMCIIRDNATVQGVAFEADLDKSTDGTVIFKTDSSHWECKVLYCVFYYSLVANYTWVMVEGIYLYNILFAHVMDPEKYICIYLIFGWTFPCFVLVPWILVRYYIEDYFCWNTHPTNSFWILQSIIMGSILINSFFFLKIIHLIFLKLYNETRSQLFSLIRLVKSMLILIPLFGLQYIILIVIPDEGVNDTTRVAKNYLEHIFNSFQGFVVSILFCFMNSEVQVETKGAWDRCRRRKPNFFNSRTLTSTMSYTTRERSPSALPPCCGITGSEGNNGLIPMNTRITSEPHYSNVANDKNSHGIPFEQPGTLGEKSSGNEVRSTVMTDEHTAMLQEVDEGF